MTWDCSRCLVWDNVLSLSLKDPGQDCGKRVLFMHMCQKRALNNHSKVWRLGQPTKYLLFQGTSALDSGKDPCYRAVIPSPRLKMLESLLATRVRKEVVMCGEMRRLPKTVAKSSSMTISDPEFRKDLARFMTASDAARPNGTNRVSSRDKEN